MFGMFARPGYRRCLAVLAGIEVLYRESQLAADEVGGIDRTLVGGVVRAVAALHAATVLVGLEGTVLVAGIDLDLADRPDPIGGVAGDLLTGTGEVVAIRTADDRLEGLVVGTVAVAHLRCVLAVVLGEGPVDVGALLRNDPGALEFNPSYLAGLGLYDCCEEIVRQLHLGKVDAAYVGSLLGCAASFVTRRGEGVDAFGFHGEDIQKSGRGEE